MSHKEYNKIDKKENPIGRVVETLAGLRYRVRMDDGKEIIAYVSGKLKINKINVQIGDKVEVLLDPYGGKASNRIVFRYRQ